MKGALGISGWLAGALLLSGCIAKRFDQRLSEAEGTIRNQRDALDASKDSEQVRLTWKEACKLLDERNQRLLQARRQQASVERDRKRFALDQFNPRVTAVANLSAALGDLARLDDRDYGIRLLGSFSVPNPMTVYARRYSLELQYYLGSLSLNELERRMQASLYAEFLRHAAEHEKGRAWMPQEGRGSAMVLDRLVSDAKTEISQNRRRSQLRVGLNQLLGTPGANWRPDSSTLPDISYEKKLAKLDPKKGYGQLALKQAAGQVEAALANLWRVKLERLPDFATGVSVPTLYDSRLDEEGFAADNTRLFGSMNQSFDLNGNDAKRARDAAERAVFVQDSIRSRLEREMHVLDNNKDIYQSLLKESELLQMSLDWMDANPPDSSNVDVLMKRLNDQHALLDRMQQNQMQRRQLELEFWVWDEDEWKSPF